MQEIPSTELKVKGLVKAFATFKLGPVDVVFRPGETIALLGKNGAGKTTLFELMTGHLDATEGTVHLNGHRLTPETTDIKRQLGYLPQHPRLPLWVTPHDLLLYGGSLFYSQKNLQRKNNFTPKNSHPEINILDQVEEIVNRSELYWDCASYRHKPLASLSYGMQKRVGLALATLHDPPVLILDEPHSGLDIFHCRALDDAIKRRTGEGKITIISTHVASFAAASCSKVIVLERGQLEEIPSWTGAEFVERIRLIENRFFAPN